jgi:hypothetical protein
MPGIQSNESQIRNSGESSTPVVLYVGTDEMQAAYLKEAGYSLHVVETAEKALPQLERLRAEVVIIGHGLGMGIRIQLEGAIRLLRPKPRVVLLYETSISQTEQADAVLNIKSEPQLLVQTVRYLLTGSD